MTCHVGTQALVRFGNSLTSKLNQELPPSLEELQELWQNKIASNMTDEQFRTEWRQLAPELQSQLIDRLSINYFDVILYFPYVNSKEDLYLESTLVPAGRASWLQLVVNHAGSRSTRRFLDSLFTLQDWIEALTPEARLASYLAQFGSYPALPLLLSTVSLCAAGHWTGFWKPPVARWLHSYLAAGGTRTRSHCEHAAELSTPPTLAEGVLSHLALVNGEEFMVRALFVYNAERPSTQQQLNTALLKTFFPASLAEVLTQPTPRLPLCTCLHLCTLCRSAPAERTITGFDLTWMPEGKARVCKSCRSFSTIAKQTPLTKELVSQSLITRPFPLV